MIQILFRWVTRDDCFIRTSRYMGESVSQTDLSDRDGNDSSSRTKEMSRGNEGEEVGGGKR